jgi:hypothetical protein
MVPKLARLVSALDARTDEFLADLEAMSPEQRTFRPGGEAWSPVMVAHHLALVEIGAAERMVARQVGLKRRRRLRQKLFYPIVHFVLRSSLRVKVPSRRMLPDSEVGFEDVRRQWQAAREAIRSALESLRPEEVCEEAFRHPIAGPVDFAEGIGLALEHVDHHRRQIDRIRSSPGYPPSAARA